MTDLKTSVLLSSRDITEKSVRNLIAKAKARLENRPFDYTEGYVAGLESALALMSPLLTTVDMFRENQ